MWGLCLAMNSDDEPSNAEEKWLEWRRKGIGASDVGALFNNHPFSTPRTIWNNIFGKERRVFENRVMRKGKELEGIIFPQLRSLFGVGIREQVCLNYKKVPIISATLDGLSDCGNMVFEVKYCHDTEKYLKMRFPPFHHKMQLQQQLLCSGASIAFYIVSNDMRTWKCFVEEPDWNVQQEIIAKVKSYWENHIESGIPPEDNRQRVQIRTDDECIQRCKRMLELKHYIEEYEAIKEELKQMGGTQPYYCEGVRFSCTPRSGGYRYSELVNLRCVQDALRENGYSMSQFKEPDAWMRRVYFSYKEP